MSNSLRIASIALGLALGFGTIAAQADPRALTAREMDRITAGLVLDLATAASAAGGSFVMTQVNGGGTGSQTLLPGGGTAQSGVIGGTASAVGTSGGASTGVATAGAVNGIALVNQTVGGTVAAPGGQASLGFTYVSGGTFFLP
jgi:hypothetical protein